MRAEGDDIVLDDRRSARPLRQEGLKQIPTDRLVYPIALTSRHRGHPPRQSPTNRLHRKGP